MNRIKWNSKNKVAQATQEEIKKQQKLKKEKPLVYEKIKDFSRKVSNGQSIAIIQLQYDYTCNFSCQHCSISKFQRTLAEDRIDNKKILTPDLVKDLADQADKLGLAHFVITGGQPLIFPEFDKIVQAINPERFFITSDTNGWLLDYKKAKHLKEIGIDKIQLSLDGMDEKQHDQFRRKPGSWEHCMQAIQSAKKVGLDIIIATVVWKGRSYTEQFKQFLEFGKRMEVPIFVSLAKPVGAWQGNYDSLVDYEQLKHIQQLGKTYNVFTHLTSSYGYELGCIAVKRMVSITKYGDVMPCPFIHATLGNLFEQPLKDIIQRGLTIKYFGDYADTCWCALNQKFIKEKVAKTYGRELPIKWQEMFKLKDIK